MNSSLTLLVLAQYFPPDIGGARTRVANVVQGLLSRGCKVKVIAAFPHYPNGKVPKDCKHKALALEKYGNAKVLRVWIPALPHSSMVNRVILHVCFVVSSLFALPFVGDFDVIWAANPNLFCFYSALVYAFARRKPIVRNVDDLWPEVFYELGFVPSKLLKTLLDFLAKLSYILPSAITPISYGYKRRIIDTYHVTAEKIHVLEVGVGSVDPHIFGHTKKSKFIAMYSGALGRGYDFQTVLKAAESLLNYDDIVFLIRGVGELAPTIGQAIRKSNLTNVAFETNILPENMLIDLLRTADVFLLPMSSASSVEEGLPAKIFEYQAYGKPVICISSGESARYVKDVGCGLIVQPGDNEGLANAIVELYKNRKLASELGQKGLRHVSKNLTSDHIGERMYRVLASVVKQRNTSKN